MGEELDYEEWLDKADSELVCKFKNDCVRYSDDMEEDYYYSNIKFWNKTLNK